MNQLDYYTLVSMVPESKEKRKLEKDQKGIEKIKKVLYQKKVKFYEYKMRTWVFI